MIEFSTHLVDGALIVTCEGLGPGGEPKSAHREALYHAVQEREAPRVAADLGEVNYLASADIGFLISLRRRVVGRGGRFVLFHVDPMILDVLRTMKLSHYFTVADDLQQALALLGPASAGAPS